MKDKPKETDQPVRISRRDILTVGGTSLVAATLLAPSLNVSVLAQEPARVKTKNGGMKPTVLPKEGSKDPVDFSIAENAFWNEQLMEHAKFFVMLMPVPELNAQRAEAEKFMATFAGQLQKSKSAGLDRNNYVAFNRSTIELVKPFADWKHKMGDMQASGKLRSLVWSSFFDHTANEADRFAIRLDQFSRGDTSTDMNEAARFWTMIMGEHAGFIAHLLDPEERTLIAKAMQTSDGFRAMHNSTTSSKAALEKAVDDIIDFKTAAEKGIETGAIKSIIHPALADHVRREAIKAADELKRATLS